MTGTHHVNSSHDIDSALNYHPIQAIAPSATTNTNIIQHNTSGGAVAKSNSATPTKKQLVSEKSPSKGALRSSIDHGSNQNSPARPVRTTSSNSASPSSPLVSPNASDNEMTSVLIRNEDPDRWDVRGLAKGLYRKTDGTYFKVLKSARSAAIHLSRKNLKDKLEVTMVVYLFNEVTEEWEFMREVSAENDKFAFRSTETKGFIFGFWEKNSLKKAISFPIQCSPRSHVQEAQDRTPKRIKKMLSLLDRFEEILDGYMRGNRPAPANLSSSRNLENSVGDDDPASSPSAGGSMHESYEDSWNNNQPTVEQSDATLIAKVSSLFNKSTSSCDPEEVVQILNPVLNRHGIDELDFRRVLNCKKKRTISYEVWSDQTGFLAWFGKQPAEWRIWFDRIHPILEDDGFCGLLDSHDDDYRLEDRLEPQHYVIKLDLQSIGAHQIAFVFRGTFLGRLTLVYNSNRNCWTLTGDVARQLNTVWLEYYNTPSTCPMWSTIESLVTGPNLFETHQHDGKTDYLLQPALLGHLVSHFSQFSSLNEFLSSLLWRAAMKTKQAKRISGKYTLKRKLSSMSPPRGSTIRTNYEEEDRSDVKRRKSN
jgi:hypothetical protein